MESIEYLGRQLPLLGHYDTVVVGGGAAGAAAGIRCAIDGQKVLLVEKGAFLGGTGRRKALFPPDHGREKAVHKTTWQPPLVGHESMRRVAATMTGVLAS